MKYALLTFLSMSYVNFDSIHLQEELTAFVGEESEFIMSAWK